MPPLLELKNVASYYGSVQALKSVSLRVEQGEVVTLLGANGAGKSTTLRTISGLLRPASGEVWFDRIQRRRRLHRCHVLHPRLRYWHKDCHLFKLGKSFCAVKMVMRIVINHLML